MHELHAFRGSRCPKKHQNRTFVQFPNLRRPADVELEECEVFDQTCFVVGEVAAASNPLI